MMEGSHFAKSIADASWNQFRQFLTYKAAEAGRKLGVVNPAINAGIQRTGISMQRRIFWPSNWRAWEYNP